MCVSLSGLIYIYIFSIYPNSNSGPHSRAQQDSLSMVRLEPAFFRTLTTTLLYNVKYKNTVWHGCVNNNKLCRSHELNKDSEMITFSRSCSWRASANSLLSMQDAAATSKGVEPLIPTREAPEHENTEMWWKLVLMLQNRRVPTQTDATILQQVTQVVEHGALVLSADPAEITQEPAAVGHHAGEPNLLQTTNHQHHRTHH